jgi:hypothetical protein
MDAYIYVQKANLALMKGESVRDYEMLLRTKINDELGNLRPQSPNGPGGMLYIEYLYVDSVIIGFYNSLLARDVNYSVPYKRDAKGVFTLGKPQEVQERKTYVPVAKAVWSAAYINTLPDSSFLHIESGGKKDEEGKTVPRSLRHFPYKDDKGKIDLPHLRNAVARIPQAKIAGLSADDLSKLQAKAQDLLKKENERLARESKQDKKKMMKAAGFEVLPSSLWEGLPL